MNPFEFVITLMIVIFAFRIISHRMGMHQRRQNERLLRPRQKQGEQLRPAFAIDDAVD